MNFDPKMAKVEHIKQRADGLSVYGRLAEFAASGLEKINADDLTLLRWIGIYQQKPNEGHFMWRIKLPGGRLAPSQLRGLGHMAQRYGRGFSDITTRQDIQFHWFTLQDFPEAFARLQNELGLHSIFACGDTPRNITSCPLDGLLAGQSVQLGDLVRQVSDLFKAGGSEFSNLPRKFKTSLAACPIHCHQPQINDVGTFAVRHRDGRAGLGVVVGGGLSSSPMFAQGLRIFVPAEKIAQQIPDIFRHAALIFRDSDELRFKRKQARMKFLVAQKGWQWFGAELQKRLGYELEQDETIVNPVGGLYTDHTGIVPLNNGLFSVGVPVERGRWSGEQMIALADLTERFAQSDLGEIRLSQRQNALLLNIPQAHIEALCAELKGLGLPADAPLWRQSLVSCTGTQFCNLAVVETKQRAKEILEYLESQVELDSPIMVSVSGCPNSCAQLQISDIGLTGTKAIYNDLKVDAYDVLVGGALGENPKFGRQILAKVPAQRVREVIAAVARAYLEHRIVFGEGDVEAFRDFAARYTIEQLAQWAAIEGWTPPPPRQVRLDEAAAIN